MQRYQLDAAKYKLLRSVDFSELGEDIIFYDDVCSFETNNIRLLQIILNEEIACKGMTADQQYASEYGWQLYDLYDEILTQKRKYQSE